MVLLHRNGTELLLADGSSLGATYRLDEAEIGEVVLRLVDADSFDSREARFRLDPWYPEGFGIREWPEAKALIVCGAGRLLVLNLPSLTISATLPLESEECQVSGQPWFVNHERFMLVCTSTRLFCLDERLAFRWCWTVHVWSTEWWEMDEPPSVEGEIVRVPLRSVNRDVEVKLRLSDALALPNEKRSR